jgi:low temperature requirement protein LtrA
MHDGDSENGAPVERVSTLELFFDLVFVFAITQLSHVFGHAHSVVDFLRAFLVLAVVWWMYAGYAWLTSNVRTDRLAYRLSPTHFVERHGLVVLIAIGESVAATGGGAAELPVGIPLLTAVVLGLALAAGLWWSYFDRDASARRACDG